MPSSGCLPTPLAWSRGATCSGRCPSGPWGPEPVLAPWPPPDVTQGCRSMVRAQTFPSGAAVPSASPVGLPGGEAGRAPAEQTCALCQGPLRSLCPFIVRLSGLNRGPGGAGPRAAAVKRTPEHPAPLRWHLCVLGRGQGRLVPGEGFGPQKAHQLMGWEREGHLCGWRNAANHGTRLCHLLACVPVPTGSPPWRPAPARLCRALTSGGPGAQSFPPHPPLRGSL